jgi:glycosyltransferase involved in cell wall biosynthesis
VRVALLTTARGWRGSGTSFVHITRGLVARGHTVQVLTAAPAVTAELAARGPAVRELAIRHSGLTETRLLRRALGEFEPDVLIADKPRDLWLGALASLGRPFTLVYRHNVGAAAPPRDLTVRLAYRRVGLTIFLTHVGERQALASAPFMDRPPRRVIYEGVDPGRFRPDPEAGRAFRERHGLGDGPWLLAVGALEREKRHHWLLGALARLPEPRPPLVLCGDGGLAAELREQAARERLDLRLVGFVTSRELAAAYNAATCVVHGCNVETFGLAVAEAMACGRPVVGVDGGAVPEVLGGTGMVAPADDPASFARAVGELLADPQRCDALGAAARRRALAWFSLERMGREYGEALEAVSPRR